MLKEDKIDFPSFASKQANLQAYLSGCAKLGVPSSDLFTLSDIANNDKASLAQV